MKIALAQLNPTVGAVRSNSEQVVNAAHMAAAAGANLVVTSELFISGYPPKDLLLREGFVSECETAVARVATQLPPGLSLLVGHPACNALSSGRLVNAVSLLANGRVAGTIHKQLLPNYDVFDEQRYFQGAEAVNCLKHEGLTLGVHVCEDAWWPAPGTDHHDAGTGPSDPVSQLAAQGADVLINLSASPFELDKPDRRLSLFEHHAGRHKIPFLFVNQAGGNDDLVFDGNSLVLNRAGHLVQQLAAFESDIQVVDLAALPTTRLIRRRVREEDLLGALTLGLRDYMTKCGFSDCVLGLSGGIDSAVAACVAARAVGPQHVHALLLPSRYSSEHSVSDARLLAERLGIDHEVIPINRIHTAFEEMPTIGSELASRPAGLAEQNLQARIRGALVMERSNHNGWLALATGNKSELAVGYCTLYGDMAGGFAVLCDVLKRDVYAVARYINSVSESGELIPTSTIDKPPSAELAPDQTDQDTLPEYAVLDAILEGLVEQERSVASLAQELPSETVRWVADRLDRNEFKRRQMPTGIKLSSRAFGSGRRMPIAARLEIDETPA